VLMLSFYSRLVTWCQQGAWTSMREGGRNFVAYRFVELASVCLLAMSATEHRLTTPSNMLPIALVISLLLASRVRQTLPAFMHRPTPVAPATIRRRALSGPRGPRREPRIVGTTPSPNTGR
jgi:hypothetical protein